MGNIIWLASYPKSGNTWFRTFITNLIGENKESFSINQLKTDGIFSSRQIVDKAIGIETSNLTNDEIDRLRPEVYHYLTETATKTLYVKVHDAYTYLEDGNPLLGTVNAKAVYILRNPLDVATSFSNHISKDLNTTIQIMNNESYCFCNNSERLQSQFRQKLLSWSQHVESWMQQTEIPVHLIRYENMKRDPLVTFTAAVRFMGLTYTENEIKQAIEASDFDKLKAEEQKNGFNEKPYKAGSFFRKGEIGDWRNHLSEEQRDQIISDHEAVMSRFGYLDGNGKMIY